MYLHQGKKAEKEKTFQQDGMRQKKNKKLIVEKSIRIIYTQEGFNHGTGTEVNFDEKGKTDKRKKLER